MPRVSNSKQIESFTVEFSPFEIDDLIRMAALMEIKNKNPGKSFRPVSIDRDGYGVYKVMLVEFEPK